MNIRVEVIRCEDGDEEKDIEDRINEAITLAANQGEEFIGTEVGTISITGEPGTVESRYDLILIFETADAPSD